VAAGSPKILGGGIWVDEGLDRFEWCEGAGQVIHENLIRAKAEIRQIISAVSQDARFWRLESGLVNLWNTSGTMKEGKTEVCENRATQ